MPEKTLSKSKKGKKYIQKPVEQVQVGDVIHYRPNGDDEYVDARVTAIRMFPSVGVAFVTFEDGTQDTFYMHSYLGHTVDVRPAEGAEQEHA